MTIRLPELINGRRVILDPRMVKKVVRRLSWRERWWKPWRTTKLECIPSDEVLLSGNIVIMHPHTYEKYKAERD